MHSLPIFVRLRDRPVILLGDGEAADAKRRLLERAQAQIIGEDGQAALAIVAIEDDAEAQAAIARLKARGILVNAVDRAAACDFTLPAIVDRDPVIMAKALRQRLEAMIPAGLGAVARTLGASRTALRQRWPNGADRRRAIDSAFEEGGPLDPFGEADETSVTQWLEGAGSGATARFHHVVVTSNDPDDLSIRTARLLAQADLVLHQAAVAPAVLNRARADAQRTQCETAPDMPPPGMTVFVEWQG